MAGLVVAIADIVLEVVLADPGQDVFGIQGDGLAEIRDKAGQFELEQAHGIVEQELEADIGGLAQQAGEVTVGGQASLGVKAPGAVGGGRQQGKAQDSD